MKTTYVWVLALLIFAALPETAQAQNSSSKTVVVVGPRGNRVKRRHVRRKVRRVRRRARFRALRRLPVGTKAILFRNVRYYPVAGVYYVQHEGVYIRRMPPVGFRVRTLPRTFLRLSVLNRPFIYSEGIFYKEVDDDFEVVEAPLGAIVEELPEEAEEILLEDISAYELYDILYEKTDEGYEVIGKLESDDRE